MGLTKGGTTNLPGLAQAGISGLNSVGLLGNIFSGNTYGDTGTGNGFNYYGTLSDGNKGWNTDLTGFVPGGITGAKEIGLLDNILSSTGLDSAGLGGITGMIGGLGQLYLGNKQMGLMEDVLKQNLAMAQEKQGWTRDELSRVNSVRNNLNAGYQHGNYAPSPIAKTYS